LDSTQDVAFVAAQVLSGKGEHGFDDRHRGQMMVVTGEKIGDVKIQRSVNDCLL
jgi:hypothetical protein